jgi:hypothetical protein
MTFEDAMACLRMGQHVRRADWRWSIGWPPGVDGIVLFYDSGFTEFWRPTLADIQAADWKRTP